MTTEATTTGDGDDETWDEAQIENALAQIEELQEQLDSLRYVLTDLLQPLARTAGVDRAQLRTSVQKAAVDTTETLKGFREAWSAEQTQSVLRKAQQSLAVNPDLSKAADVPAWGWEKG